MVVLLNLWWLPRGWAAEGCLATGRRKWELVENTHGAKYRGGVRGVMGGGVARVLGWKYGRDRALR
jgi:hypothetical protein